MSDCHSLKAKNEDWAAMSTQQLLVAMAVAMVATLWMWDPRGVGPLGGFRYRPMKHTLAPYQAVMSAWPRDPQDRLGRWASPRFRGEIHGPESLLFDSQGRGPYTGLADGRLVRWIPNNHSHDPTSTAAPQGGGRWELFALPSVIWNSSCLDDNTIKLNKPRDERSCGRPLGLRFHKEDHHLYFADSYYGLLRVQPEGGIASILTQEAGGEQIKFANDLDIHQNGSIFFTDSSARHNRLEHLRILLEGENTGRLLRYDPDTEETSVVLKGLSFANGVQLSEDQSFLLITETTNCRILRYWLEGSSKGKLEVFADLPGFPDNVRINEKGQFWVAIDCCRTWLQDVFSTRPWLRYTYFRLPLPASFLFKIVGMRMYTVIALFDSDGKVVDVLEDAQGRVVQLVSEVQQKGNTLWIGTVAHQQITTFTYQD